MPSRIHNAFSHWRTQMGSWEMYMNPNAVRQAEMLFNCSTAPGFAFQPPVESCANTNWRYKPQLVDLGAVHKNQSGRKSLNFPESIHLQERLYLPGALDCPFREPPCAHIAEFILCVPCDITSNSVSTTSDRVETPGSGSYHHIH